MLIPKPTDELVEARELCEWLRAHSSGAYRPAAEAAGLIERLQAALAESRAAVPAKAGTPPGYVLVPVKIRDDMIEAAVEAHYGKAAARRAGGATGIDMAVNGENFTAAQALRRMWKGAISVVAGAKQPGEPR